MQISIMDCDEIRHFTSDILRGPQRGFRRNSRCTVKKEVLAPLRQYQGRAIAETNIMMTDMSFILITMIVRQEKLWTSQGGHRMIML